MLTRPETCNQLVGTEAPLQRSCHSKCVLAPLVGAILNKPSGHSSKTQRTAPYTSEPSQRQSIVAKKTLLFLSSSHSDCRQVSLRLGIKLIHGPSPPRRPPVSLGSTSVAIAGYHTDARCELPQRSYRYPHVRCRDSSEFLLPSATWRRGFIAGRG